MSLRKLKKQSKSLSTLRSRGAALVSAAISSVSRSPLAAEGAVQPVLRLHPSTEEVASNLPLPMDQAGMLAWTDRHSGSARMQCRC